jgi:hypothetical protein
MLQSFKEISPRVEGEDLLLECITTISVEISIERAHHYERDVSGNLRLVLGSGYLVSFGLPPRSTVTSESPNFADGEKFMVAELKYMGMEGSQINIFDAIKALNIDPDAKLWTVSNAP